MYTRLYRPCQAQDSLHLSDTSNRESRGGPEKERHLLEVTHHQATDSEYCTWKPYMNHKHLPELVLPHVVNVQGLFPLRQDPELHLPASLPLPTFLFCLEREESQARVETWRLKSTQSPEIMASASNRCSSPPPPDPRAQASTLLPQTQRPRLHASSLRHRSTGPILPKGTETFSSWSHVV